MNRTFKVAVTFVLCALLASQGVFAGNPDRAGEAGAYELLINPFARSSGLYGLNTANTKGVESLVVNPAGMAATKKTEVVFTYNSWLTGTGININAVGLAQKFGKDKSNVIGLNLNAMSFGKIERTTTSNPEGGLGTFSPTFINLAIGYSRIFSNSINAGVTVRMVNEKIDNLSATGACFDIGIQYSAGKKKNVHFGIALRNIGLPMSYSGDGLSFRGNATEGTYTLAQDQKSAKFDMPSQLNIGVAYDWLIDKNKENPNYRLTFDFGYNANSFGKDQVGLGAEFSWKEMVQLRVAYRYEKGLTSTESRTSAYTGLAAGATFEIPIKKDGPAIGIDYSYRTSSPFDGTHSVGLHFNL